jgi:hypothetical protein
MFEEIVGSSWFFYGGLVYMSATSVYVMYKIISHFEKTNKRLDALEKESSS